jgi:hypothetical protein
MRWTAAHGLQSLVSAELGGIEVRVASEATALHDRDGLQVDAAPASAVVLAMPDPRPPGCCPLSVRWAGFGPASTSTSIP